LALTRPKVPPDRREKGEWTNGQAEDAGECGREFNARASPTAQAVRKRKGDDDDRLTKLVLGLIRAQGLAVELARVEQGGGSSCC